MLDINTWIRFAVWMAIGESKILKLTSFNTIALWELLLCMSQHVLFLLGLPIYFFSVRLYPKTAHNSSIRIKSETVAHQNGKTQHLNGTSNGYINQAFHEETETKNHEAEEDKYLPFSSPRLRKKYHAPPAPSVTNETQTSSIDLDLALAALDDVLFVEESKTYSRKVSVGSVSNGSKGFNEHDVVALVHREDVNSHVETLPTLTETSENATEVSDIIEPKPIGSSIEVTEENVGIKDLDEESAKAFDDTSKNQTKQSYENEDVTNLDTLELPSKNMDSKDLDKEPAKISVTTLNNDTKQSKGNGDVKDLDALELLPKNSDENVDNPKTDAESFNSDDKNSLLSPPPPPLPLASYEIPAIPRITKSLTDTDLKSVTLKSTRPQSPPIDYDEPTDDHLTFGTLQHKNFKDRLENIIRHGSMTSEPASPISPKTPIRPKTVGPSGFANNEFVIQDRIRTSDARKTLNEFFLSDKAIFPNGLRPVSNNPKVALKIGNNKTGDENGGAKLNDGELMKLEHRQRMAGTLRSIKLRKVDSFKDD